MTVSALPVSQRIGSALGSLIAAAIGGALASWAHLPVPWFLGGLAGAAVLCRTRQSILPDSVLRDLGFLLMGYSAGRDMAMASGTLSGAGSGLLFVWIAAGVLGFGLAWFAARASLRALAPNWTDETRRFAAIPGSMTAVLAVAASRDCALERVALVHLSRLALLCLLLPLLALGADAPRSDPIVPPIAWWAILPVLGVAALVSRALSRIRIAASALLAAIICAAVGSALTSVPPLPDTARAASALFIASYLAPSFARAWRSLTPSLVLPTLASALSSLLAGACVALALWCVIGGDLRALLLGLAPGGLEVALLTAASSGTEPGPVLALQFTRYTVALFTLTFIGRHRDTPP